MPTETIQLTDVYIHNGSLASLSGNLVLSSFTQTSGELEVDDSDDQNDFDTSESATFDGTPASYVGGGTATVGVNLAGLGLPTSVNASSSVDVNAFSSGGDTYFNYPDGDPASLFDGLVTQIATLLPLLPLETITTYVEENAILFFDLDPTSSMPVCFAADALIDTDRGPVAAGDLVPGDMVRTRDHGLQPVRWVGRRHLGALDLLRAPQFRPIRIRAGALGSGLPATDLVVSPQHRVLVRSSIARRMTDHPEVLVAAKHLTDLPGVAVARDLDRVDYVHILFDRHEIVWANGAETESFYPGTQALDSLTAAARSEVTALFPELEQPAALPARPLVTGRVGRRLADRHRRNGRNLVA